jgi:hypothetical protein
MYFIRPSPDAAMHNEDKFRAKLVARSHHFEIRKKILRRGDSLPNPQIEI